jgi:voltage-gated potassium channel Kch
MHIVVIGLGEVGRHLLGVLDGEGHDVVAIDADPEHVAYAEEHFDVATMVGYGASQDTLDAAGVAKADLVVAVTNHDEVNLIAALAAKRQGANRVIGCAGSTAGGIKGERVVLLSNEMWAQISKIIFAFTMLLGRLELFTLLALFVPEFWKQ